MKDPRFERWARPGLAALGGLLLAAAFPKLGVAGFAWAAPGVILASAMGTGGWRAFRLGYLAGLIHFLTSLYWLLHIPVIKILPITAWAALSAFLALYSGAWVWLCWRLCPARLAGSSGPQEVFERFLATNWAQRTVWTLSCAALWVTWEMIQARLFTGFPWNPLGASQYQMLPIIQIASYSGVYGVSFLSVWFSISSLSAMIYVLRRSHQTRRWMGELALPLLVTMGVVYGGLRQLVPAGTPQRSLKLALVQPSIPQQWIWSPDDTAKRFAQLLALSTDALTNRPDLLVWPEAATPGYLRWQTNVYQPISNLVHQGQVWLVLGGDDAGPRAGAPDPDDMESYNSSFLLSPQGEIKGNYRKRRLVIFGEYIPFHRWLPFLEQWGMGSFAAGEKTVAFQIPELGVKLSVLICFEDNFPHYTREYVEGDTDFLLNLTNNGWFGESAAQWQHAASAVFRAVENRVTLVRCTNNGLTCRVDPQGRMSEVFFPGSTDIYGVGVKVVEVPLLAGTQRALTFYWRHGDMFGWGCVLWSALGLGWSWLAARRERRERSGNVSGG